MERFGLNAGGPLHQVLLHVTGRPFVGVPSRSLPSVTHIRHGVMERNDTTYYCGAGTGPRASGLSVSWFSGPLRFSPRSWTLRLPETRALDCATWPRHGCGSQAY
jgi:hypothetical protein